MNKVILQGRLTTDAELRYTPNGVAVGSVNLAAPRRFKRDGEPDADFIPLVLWKAQAENTANMVGKGCRVSVIGRWNTRNYEGQDGKKVYVNECIVEEITFIDFKDNQGNPSNGQNQQQSNQGGQNGGGYSQGNQRQGQQHQNGGGGQYGGQGYRNNDDPFANQGGPIDISDDDLPF